MGAQVVTRRRSTPPAELLLLGPSAPARDDPHRPAGLGEELLGRPVNQLHGREVDGPDASEPAGIGVGDDLPKWHATSWVAVARVS